MKRYTIIKIEDFIVENLRTKYETRLKEKRTTLEEIDRDIKRKAILYNAEIRLLSFINIWEILEPLIPSPAHLHCVKLVETPRIYIEYFG
jgi:hypothetical protein